jgi:branched-chain amino acid transport system ATP-binding protein
MTVLRVDRLAKYFGGLMVLKDVSFEVRAGEKLALIGPNGAGKTTLLNMIGGQLAVTGGHVFLEDRDITKLSPNRRLHLGVGRSFQINNLFFELSVLDNMLLALHGAERRHLRMFQRLERRCELLEEAESKLEMVGLADKRHESLQVQS